MMIRSNFFPEVLDRLGNLVLSQGLNCCIVHVGRPQSPLLYYVHQHGSRQLQNSVRHALQNLFVRGRQVLKSLGQTSR
jgi:hypothetical protein